MTGESTTLLSVRADAQLEVTPDEAALDCVVGALDDDKAAALRVLTRRLDAATGALRDLGGVVRHWRKRVIMPPRSAAGCSASNMSRTSACSATAAVNSSTSHGPGP